MMTDICLTIIAERLFSIGFNVAANVASPVHNKVVRFRSGFVSAIQCIL